VRFLKNTIQHRFNALHVYCILCKLGVKSSTARALAVIWEGTGIYRLIYKEEKKWRVWQVK